MNFFVIMLSILLTVLYFESKVVTITWLRGILFMVAAISVYGVSVYKKNKKFSDILREVENITDGNYTLSLDKGNNKGKLRDIDLALNNLKVSLRKGSFEAQAASSQVMAVSEQLAITMRDNTEFADTLAEQARVMAELNINSLDEINIASTQIESMKSMMGNIEGFSSEVESTEKKSKEIINESFVKIVEIVDSVGAIEKATNTTVNCIKELSLTVGEISSILNTVNAIASQTELLSLNASIESARAGEYGKGFGVVADEIRKLSENSRGAVSRISELISEIILQMSNLKEAINPNEICVKKSVDCSRNIEVSLNRIKETYDNVQGMINKIMDTSIEEGKLITDICGKISNVKEAFSETSASVECVYSSVKKQNEGIKEIDVMGKSLKSASESLTLIGNKDDIGKYSEEYINSAQEVIKLIKTEILILDDFSDMNEGCHKRVLDDFRRTHTNIEAIWTNDIRGRFIYSNPAAGIVNANVRDWFKEAVSDKEYISNVYISAITKTPCVTVSISIEDSKGCSIGVIGADIGINM